MGLPNPAVDPFFGRTTTLGELGLGKLGWAKPSRPDMQHKVSYIVPN